MHDVTIYTGSGPCPEWNPRCDTFTVGLATSLATTSGVRVLDNVLAAEDCASLIEQFEQQEMYPVGVDGYSNGDLERAGSFRAMAWATDLAAKLRVAFRSVPDEFYVWQGNLIDHVADLVIAAPATIAANSEVTYSGLGPTPWMRFMRYKHGGMHVPHYDVPFECPTEHYITLFSWVLYLNTIPRGDGGTFDFVDDGRHEPVCERPQEAFRDWNRMAHDDEIIWSVSPRRGRLLVFPHWLCHQVSPYRGPDHRYIIRGDLAYGIGP